MFVQTNVQTLQPVFEMFGRTNVGSASPHTRSSLVCVQALNPLCEMFMQTDLRFARPNVHIQTLSMYKKGLNPVCEISI